MDKDRHSEDSLGAEIALTVVFVALLLCMFLILANLIGAINVIG